MNEVCGDWATNQWWFWYFIVMHSFALVLFGRVLLRWWSRGGRR